MTTNMIMICAVMVIGTAIISAPIFWLINQANSYYKEQEALKNKA